MCFNVCINFDGVYDVGVCVKVGGVVLCCCMLFVSYVWVLFVVL